MQPEQAPSLLPGEEEAFSSLAGARNTPLPGFLQVELNFFGKYFSLLWNL